MSALSPVIARRAVPMPAIALGVASDARLMRMAADGNGGAMEAIFERHYRALHRYCYSIVGNGHDASDALQNTMMQALSALPGEERTIALRPWLYRIAHNEAVSLLRARRADRDLDAAVDVCDAAAGDAVESRERLRSLTQDLTQLTERQRGALLMRELAGLDFGEVAEALGTSPAAVKQSVYEARNALHAMEEGRAMDCDAVRRALSDGDRRVARGTRMRGHLRACAGCRDFQTALHARPAQLAAIIPPLPAGAAAAMLHGLAGGSSGGGGIGIGAGLLEGAKAATGLSLGANAAAVVAVSATLAGGALVVGGTTARGEHASASGGPTVSLRMSGAMAPLLGILGDTAHRGVAGRSPTDRAGGRNNALPIARAPAVPGTPGGGAGEPASADRDGETAAPADAAGAAATAVNSAGAAGGDTAAETADAKPDKPKPDKPKPDKPKPDKPAGGPADHPAPGANANPAASANANPAAGANAHPAPGANANPAAGTHGNPASHSNGSPPGSNSSGSADATAGKPPKDGDGGTASPADPMALLATNAAAARTRP